ncbi:MAG: protein kinase [Deltaproteobacteria bacterium]|nr:protein kinase [Deltaproteobacteria bacterium]
MSSSANHPPTAPSAATSTGAKEARRKASERIGQWVRKKYRIDQLVGVGGMAAVYAATHRNGSRVALKILHTEFAREEAIKTRFLREGYVANRVDHNGRVAIQDDDETETGEAYLVMELLEGESLQQLWKRKKRKVPPIQAVQVAEAVLDTLVPFHEQKIVHRDLKPANIFLTNDGEVKLLDFGVAQMREGEGGEALTRAGTALGTPSYMSPEQAMGKSDQLDGRSDLFAVGATLYSILSGRRLHHGKSDNEAYILAATQPAPSLARRSPELPVEVIALVDRALQWDRRKRFRTAEDMRDACRQVLEALGVPPERARSVQAKLPGWGTGVPADSLIIDGTPTAPSATPSHPGPASAPAAQPSQDSMPSAVQGATTTPDAGLAAEPAALSAEVATVPPAAPDQAQRGPTPSQLVPGAQRRPSGTSGAVRPSYDKIEIDLQGADAPAPTSAAASRPPKKAAEEEGGVLFDVFRRFEKGLPTLRQYGLDHPEGQGKVRAIHRAFVDALREDPNGVHWLVHPFCFTHGKATVWEPGPPLDQVPYSLASTGVDEVRVQEGVTEDEIRTFLRAVVIDPQLGTEENDIGAALWEAGFDHIICKVRDDLTDADAREQIRFFAETAEVENEMSEELSEVVAMISTTARPELSRQDSAEAAAMAMATEHASLQAAKEAAGALALEAAARTALGTQLALADEEWRERFFDVATEAYVDAVEREDPDLLLEPLKTKTERLALAGQWPQLFELHDNLVDHLTAAGSAYARPDSITQAMFAWPVLEQAYAFAQVDELDDERRKVVVNGLEAIAPALAHDLVKEQLLVANDLPEGDLFELAMSYVDNALPGNEAIVIDMLDNLRPELAQRMLASVTATRSPEAIELLKPLLMSPNQALRCEATALLATSPEELGKQLVRLLGSGDRALRSAALTTMERHNVRLAGPGLVGVIEAEGFVERPLQEQRQMFETLYALNSPRAERLLLSIVGQHGLMADETIDRVRAVAADVLGRLADSNNPLDALKGAARMRPWNTQQVRMAAGHAMEAIEARLSRPKPPPTGADG